MPRRAPIAAAIKGRRALERQAFGLQQEADELKPDPGRRGAHARGDRLALELEPDRLQAIAEWTAIGFVGWILVVLSHRRASLI
jgi:hypothetical protein